jgi:hypothetical protein
MSGLSTHLQRERRRDIRKIIQDAPRRRKRISGTDIISKSATGVNEQADAEATEK